MRTYLDANVFLYSFLDQDAEKKIKAVEIIAKAVESNSGFISLQVVREFCNVMLKKSKRSLSELKGALRLFDSLQMIDGSMSLIRRALEIKDRYKIQFFDSLHLASAEVAGCDEILTEDLNDGQMYGSVKAVNPFK